LRGFLPLLGCGKLMKSIGAGNKASSRNRISRSSSTARRLGFGAARFVFPSPSPSNPLLMFSTLPHLTPLSQNTEFLFTFRLFPHAIHHSSPLLFSPLLPFPPSPYNTQTPLTSQLPPVLARSLLPPLLPRRACRPVRCARGGICIRA